MGCLGARRHRTGLVRAGRLYRDGGNCGWSRERESTARGSNILSFFFFFILLLMRTHTPSFAHSAPTRVKDFLMYVEKSVKGSTVDIPLCYWPKRLL
jgi:hypothetical protein